jgi:hypothetical protein
MYGRVKVVLLARRNGALTGGFCGLRGDPDQRAQCGGARPHELPHPSDQGQCAIAFAA